jgi:hypothetical protein
VKRVIVDELIGRFAAASNLTLLARSGGEPVIYKPVAGNRPLWDFDVNTLATREFLTFRVSELMGLGVVPETALGEGPLGPGAVQRFVEEDPAADPLDLVRSCDEALWPIAVLDLVVNNADRKAGHLLTERATGRLQAIDHGLTFHPDDKLRTVLWCFAGRSIPPPLVGALDALRGALGNGFAGEVCERLGDDVAEALMLRVDAILSRPVHPDPPEHRPPVPWPPV